MNHLIESVRKYPCLWKVDAEEYKNNEMKEAAWTNIIAECDLTDVKEAKSTWKKLRDGLRQALNKRKTPTGQSASTETRLWKYEKQMKFLLPHLTNRQRSTNAAATEEVSQSQKDSAKTIEIAESLELNTTSNEFPQTNYSTRQNKRKFDNIIDHLKQEPKGRNHRSEDGDLAKKGLFSQNESLKPNEDSALRKFFDSMCDITGNLPENEQIKIQRRLFNSVMEARERQLETASDS